MRAQWLACVLVGLVALTGCVPADKSPQAIEANDVPSQLSDPTENWRVYVYKDTRLVPISRTIPLTANRLSTYKAVIAALSVPLNPDERAEGYESELSSAALSVASLDGSTITIDLGTSDLQQDGNKLGQIVWTLTERNDVKRVDFVKGGQHVDVVKDGGTNDVATPVTQDSYSTLIREEEPANLYLVRNGKLQAVPRSIAAASADDTCEVAANKFLDELTDGPTPAQRIDGYSSEVGRLKPEFRCSPDAKQFTVVFATGFSSLAKQDQARAIGQILYTLEGWARGSLTAVTIAVGSNVLAEVPTPVGTAPNPVEKSLYASLLEPS